MKSKSFSDKEELKYIDPNETFIQKLIRLWDYYKLFIILGIILIFICIVLAFTFTNKKGIDAYVFFITSDDSMCFSSEEDAEPFCNKFSTFLEKYGIDYSGDGKVRIELDIVYIGDSTFYDQIAELNKKKAKLDKMRKQLPKAREEQTYISRNSVPEYRYTNYDLDLVAKDYEEVCELIMTMQMALDKHNQTAEFEVDI